MQNDVTYDSEFKMRHPTKDDTALVVEYMHKLGAYQKMADEITATEPQINGCLAKSGAKRSLVSSRGFVAQIG